MSLGATLLLRFLCGQKMNCWEHQMSAQETNKSNTRRVTSLSHDLVHKLDLSPLDWPAINCSNFALMAILKLTKQSQASVVVGALRGTLEKCYNWARPTGATAKHRIQQRAWLAKVSQSRSAQGNIQTQPTRNAKRWSGKELARWRERERKRERKRERERGA